MAVKKKSKKGKAWFAVYKAKDQFSKNQKAKRAKHAKKHPNDLQSQEKATNTYKRKPPVSRNSTVQRVKYYDGAGRRVAAPEFKPKEKEDASNA